MPEHSGVNIELERHFDAPPARVFRAFTDPDQLALWFGSLSFHVPRSSVTVSARDGGFWRLLMVNNDDRAITSAVDSTFTSVAENTTLISYEDARGMPGVANGTRIILTVEFTADESGTRLNLTCGPFPPQMGEMGAVGWRQSFHKLDALLETPVYFRDPALS